MLGDTHVIVLGNVHPFCFVLENFANGAAFHAITSGNVFLPRIWVFLVINTDSFSVHIEQPLLALLRAWNDRANWWRWKGIRRK